MNISFLKLLAPFYTISQLQSKPNSLKFVSYKIINYTFNHVGQCLSTWFAVDINCPTGVLEESIIQKRIYM